MYAGRMSTVELIPVDYVRSPAGVTHLVPTVVPVEETLCHMRVGRGWNMGAQAEGSPVPCLPCRAARSEHEANVRLGNYLANDGVDTCSNCGANDWANDACTYCEKEWSIDDREEDE